jgi:hypothetical protein
VMKQGSMAWEVYHLQDESKVIAFHRWDKGGAADDVVVVANFSHEPKKVERNAPGPSLLLRPRLRVGNSHNFFSDILRRQD